MTDKNRRFLVAGSAAGLASTLLAGAWSRPALAWTDQDFAPARRRRSRDPVPADDGAFYDTRGQAADPYYRGEPAPVETPEEDSFWGGPRRQAPPPQGAVDPNAAVVVDDGPIDYARAYAAVETEPFPVQAFRWRRANPSFLRQEVAYGGRYAPGTIVVDPRAHHLYLIQEGGRARRTVSASAARVSPGTGAATINSKQAWPDWYPPKEMIAASRRSPARVEAPERPRRTGRPAQPARRPRSLPLAEQQGHALPHPWHHRAGKHRSQRVVGLHPG